MDQNIQSAQLKKCSNPELSGKIALEIAFNVAQHKGIHLTPEQSQHLVQCERCNQMLPLWFKKGEAARRGSQAFTIIDLAEEGDARVLKKNIKSGTVLFKPDNNDGQRGFLVRITSEGTIEVPQEATLDEFNRLS